MDCRICVVSEPHVHVSDTRMALAENPPTDFTFKPAKITGIDFALPAVKQQGRWWICTQELVDMVWPLYKQKVTERRRRISQEVRLGIRPPEHEREPDQEQD